MGKYISMFKRVRRFTEAEKQDIIRRYAAGELLKTIAQSHKTTPANVSDIGRRSGSQKRMQGPQPRAFRGL
jgi:transposase-like protein